ncbi:hypothetical protein LCGC14_1038750 [marine sediment metagenome]|uniref:Uncharacterized protein n=1 Tax=marine sediment metagenome TaxID=412755 RepID=A0A0F9MWX9_9ZZZZ
MSKAEKSLILSDPQRFILESPYKINLFMGGTGSGKTFIEAVISANFIKHFPQADGFIGANTYEQLNTSTLKRIRDVWRDVFGLIDGIHYVVGKRPPTGFNTDGHNFDRYDSIISFCNGAVIYKASLDNYKAHEGKEFAWAILDETKDTKEEAVKEVILHRLRQMGLKMHGEDINPLYIGTTPAKVDWINEWFELDRWEDEIAACIYNKEDYFHKEFANKCVTISSTFHNAVNLPKGHIEELLMEHTDRDGKITESGKRLIYSSPFVKAGGEFYSSFNRTIHTSDIDLIKDEPIHISYDFNVVPYITLICWQIIKREDYWEARCFDEFCLPSPDNTTEKVTKEFIRKHQHDLNAGLFYYGDPTGAARDTRSRKNDYTIIQETLIDYIGAKSNRVLYKAYPVVNRRDFINDIFDEIFDIRIIVDKGCKKMIADFEYLKEDADGKKLKTRVTDPDTKQTYEKYGHCMAKGTKISTIRGDVNIEDIKARDLVLTRYGYRRVLWAGITGENKLVRTYKIGDKILRCTPTHKIYTLFGFRQAQLLTRWTILCIFNGKKICEKQSNSTDLNFTDIKRAGILGDGLMGIRNIYTAICGNTITEQSRKAIMFITKMMTTIIIRLGISDAFQDLNIFLNTMIGYLKKSKTIRLKSLMNVQGRKLLNGITPILEGNGIDNTRTGPLSEMSEKCYVKNVETLLRHKPYKKSSSVPVNAKADTICESIDCSENGTKTENASFVKKHSQYISGRKHKLAVKSVELLSESIEPEVYDLYIDQHREYFANGILVHNCSDAADYMITAIFSEYMNKYSKQRGMRRAN